MDNNRATELDFLRIGASSLVEGTVLSVIDVVEVRIN